MNSMGNSFTNDDLRGMIVGDNPVSNAYRELLAFREAQGKAVAEIYAAPQLPSVPDDMSDEQIREIFLSNGFKTKQQPDGSVDLNPYVYDAARAMLAAATAPDSDNVTDNTAQQFESLSSGSKNG